MLRPLLWMAWAQLVARPGQAAGLIGSVGAGVAILVVALALTNGFEGAMIDRILGTSPHVALSHPLAGGLEEAESLASSLRRAEGVESAEPFVQGQGLVLTPQRASVGVLVRGLSGHEAQAKHFTQYLELGALAGSPGGRPPVVLGNEAALRLGLEVGDEVTLVAGAGSKRRLELTGIYHSGLYELDAHVAFLPLAEAQAAFGLGRMASGVGIRLAAPMTAPARAEAWSREHLLAARAWTEQNRPLLSAMSLERLLIALVLGAMVVVALVGMATTLAMWVVEKRKELAMLRAMGLSARQVSWLLLAQGALVGALGASAGLSLAALVCVALQAWPIPLPMEVYFLSSLPVAPRWQDFAWVGLATVLLAPLAAALPARKAHRQDPVASLRRV